MDMLWGICASALGLFNATFDLLLVCDDRRWAAAHFDCRRSAAAHFDCQFAGTGGADSRKDFFLRENPLATIHSRIWYRATTYKTVTKSKSSG